MIWWASLSLLNAADTHTVTQRQADGGVFWRSTRANRKRETEKREKGSLWAPSLDVSQRSLDPGPLISDARLFQTDVLSPWLRLALPLHQTHSRTKKGDNDLQCATGLCLLQQTCREVMADDEAVERQPMAEPSHNTRQRPATCWPDLTLADSGASDGDGLNSQASSWHDTDSQNLFLNHGVMFLLFYFAMAVQILYFHFRCKTNILAISADTNINLLSVRYGWNILTFFFIVEC